MAGNKAPGGVDNLKAAPPRAVRVRGAERGRPWPAAGAPTERHISAGAGRLCSERHCQLASLLLDANNSQRTVKERSLTIELCCRG